MLKVSVIIPNYNRASLIGQTIDNMLSQSLSPHELIVIDDGSTDESVQVIQSFGDRVTLIQQSNQGPGAARNAGLRIATCEFIQFMDSDDIASSNKLKVQVQALIQHEADIVYGPWAKAWIRDNQVQLENVVLQQKALSPHHHPLHWFLTSWSMVLQQCLVRRSALARVGGYREDMKLYEDGELFVRLLLAGSTLVHEAKSLTLYRLNDHGKLTSSGQQQAQRTVDTVRFYQLVIEQLSTCPKFHSILKNPEFCANVGKALHEMKSLGLEINDDDPHLRKILDIYPYSAHLSFRVWLRQKRRGLQQRIQGHRWPSSYQPGPLNHHQRQLIQMMGLTLVEEST